MKETKQNMLSVTSSLGSVEGWLSPHEGELLFHLARLSQKNSVVVEIGSWKGRSTVCLGLGLRAQGMKGRIFAVDPHEGILIGKKKIEPPTYKEFLANINRFGLSTVVIPIRKPSAVAARDWKEKIDVLFIDGLHDEFNTIQDYAAWQKYVKKDGIVAFHDGFCGEVGVWNAIRTGPLKRTDITDIGTVGSIFYIKLGYPSLLDQLRVRIKKNILFASSLIHLWHAPFLVKRMIIHVVFRLLLLTPETIAVYTRSASFNVEDTV